jgi:hypothetical protein
VKIWRARRIRRAAYVSPYRETLGGNIGAMPNLASLATWLVINGQNKESQMMTYQEKICAVDAIAAAAPAIGTPASAPGGVLYYVVDIRPADGNTCTLIGGPAPMARDRWKLTLASECGAITEASENIAARWIHRAAHHRAIGEIEAAAIWEAAKVKREETRAKMAADRAAANVATEKARADLARYKPEWAQYAITAELHEDDCDSMTDYFNAKTVRTVVIGWSKHKRDLFAEMRKAAATFPETAHLATAPESAEHREKYSMGAGYYLKEGSRYCSGWAVQKASLAYLACAGLEFAPHIIAADDAEPIAAIEPAEPIGGNGAGLFTIKRHTHSRRGFDMWICTIGERLERADFDRFLAAAKALGGWYSRAWQGTPAGFAFKSEAAALAFAGDSAGPDDEPPAPGHDDEPEAEPEPIAGIAEIVPEPAPIAEIESPAAEILTDDAQDDSDPFAIDAEILDGEGPEPLTGTAPALPVTVADIIEEYDRKRDAIPQAIAALNDAYTALKTAATVHGAYVETIVREAAPSEHHLRDVLLKSGWQAVQNRLNVAAVMTAKDKEDLKKTMAKPPELTMETAKATFGDYLIRPRFHILRGLAEAFTQLDPAYKSHSKVRMGVKGLPKRVILNYWGDYSSGYGRDRFQDMANALAAYQGKPQMTWQEMRAIGFAHDAGEDAVLDGRSYADPRPGYRKEPEQLATVDRGLIVRKFQNGNAHVFFDKWALFDINKALAEFYGEVLPDAEPENAKPQASRAVAKDLQFYWSPPAVVAAALEFADIGGKERYSYGAARPVLSVLEPSCGDGRIMDEIRARGHDVLGIEYDTERAAICKAKGHAVMTANFLMVAPKPEFDRVVMNPPFYGRHYVKHVRHALEFLKPGGVLVAVLPATAHYDHGELQGQWQDLPVASFADAGTNVPTGLLKIVKR